MIDWWNSLSIELHIFYAIGILSALVMGLRLLLTLVGFDGGDGVDFDIGDVDHGSGVGIFSTQTLSAFFVGFGWAGVLALKSGLSVLAATLIALVAGLVTMSAMYFVLRTMMRMEAKGNLDHRNAVGLEAVVYVTLPGSGQFGGGQVELKLQDRLITANAISLGPEKLPPGTRVRVTSVAPDNTLTVEPSINLPS